MGTESGSDMGTAKGNMYANAQSWAAQKVHGGPLTAKSPRNICEKCKLFGSTSNLEGTSTCEAESLNLSFIQVSRRFSHAIMLRIIFKVKKKQKEVK